jgi:hypothetical protein
MGPLLRNVDPTAVLRRVWNTAVFWTWIFNVLRFASGILIFPLLYRFLSEPDLDMYALFFVLTGFLLSFDQMFAVTISRNVGYAMRGIADIQPQGIAVIEKKNLEPNTVLLGQLLSATRKIYQYLALAILILLSAGGTLVLLPYFAETSNPPLTRAAWVITIISACLELYTGYWVVFLRGLNQVVLSARLSSFVYGIKLLLSAGLLLSGAGLLAIPTATMITGILQRILARRYTIAALPPMVKSDSTRNRELIRAIWPNTWRMGLILLSINLMMTAFGKVITWKWGLGSFYPYHFSYQILYSMCMSMAAVWTYVKWPVICQLRAVDDLGGVQRILWPRIWLQLLTYLMLAAGFIVVGPPILKWIAPEKGLLPRVWLLALAIYAFLEMHYILWTTLISTENRIPSLWAAVMTNIVSVLVSVMLMQFTNLRIGSFIVGPLLCGLALNFWFWPKTGAETLRTRWLPFMMKRSALAKRPLSPTLFKSDI